MPKIDQLVATYKPSILHWERTATIYVYVLFKRSCMDKLKYDQLMKYTEESVYDNICKALHGRTGCKVSLQ